jgi:hypothetical protein
MGLSGFSGLTGSAGDFRRRLRVDESSERRMASPWQFSPYLPSLSKCSAARSQWRRALRHVFGKTALAAIRDRDPELPIARRVCRSSSTTKMRRIATSLAASDAACRRPLAKKGTAFHSNVRRGFALRISTLPHFRRKSPACLPSTVHMASSTT